MSNHVTEPLIIDLLAAKHAKDVFVAECNTGSAHAGCSRMDAWAFRKSWSRFGAVGYEVKVSRSDFEQDQKWTTYLDYCHEFSFVCPGGLIKAHELPKGVGLIWVSQNKQRLHTKLKATHREVDPDGLVMIMAYVMMSKCRVVADMNEAAQEDEGPEDRLAVYCELVEDATKRKKLAHFVNAHIRSAYREMETRAEAAEQIERKAKTLRDALKKIGIEWDTKDNWGTWKIKSEIELLAGRIPPGFLSATRCARAGLEKLEELIEGIQGSEEEGDD